MKKESITWNLCQRDPRFPPEAKAIASGRPPLGRIQDCNCNNCYQGRDNLAQELLSSIDTLADVLLYYINSGRTLD